MKKPVYTILSIYVIKLFLILHSLSHIRDGIYEASGWAEAFQLFHFSLNGRDYGG